MGGGTGAKARQGWRLTGTPAEVMPDGLTDLPPRRGLMPGSSQGMTMMGGLVDTGRVGAGGDRGRHYT